jgi:tetratricopeptide (TPR) repeat protein
VLRSAPRRAAWLLCTLLCTLPGPACGRDAEDAGRAAAGAPAGDTRLDDRFEALRARAVQLHERGDDPSAARAALEAALALNPGHYGLNQRLGKLCLELRLHEQALAALERAHAARPEDRHTLLSVVSLQVRLGRFDEALARVAALVDDPELGGEALYQQALAFEQRGERQAARAAAHRTDGLPPERGYRCQALLGRMALEDGDLAAARTHFERALVGRPDYREALKGLADSSRRLGHDDEAGRWDRLLDLFVQLNDSAFARTPEQAVARRALLQRLTAEYPAWSAGFEELAELQRGQGDTAAACATIEAWLARHGANLAPTDAAALRRRYCADAP